MKRLLVLSAPALALLLFAGSSVRAEMIPNLKAKWGYDFGPEDGFINSDSPGTGGVSLSNEHGATAQGPSDIVVTNIKVVPGGFEGEQDFNVGGQYEVALTLKDLESGQASDPLVFTGKFGGSFTDSSANVTNTFGVSTFDRDLGANHYKVSLTGFIPPGPPGSSRIAGISAHVDVTTLASQADGSGDGSVDGSGDGTGGGTNLVPEPSSMLLSCLGLSLAGITSWRRKRRVLAVA